MWGTVVNALRSCYLERLSSKMVFPEVYTCSVFSFAMRTTPTSSFEARGLSLCPEFLWFLICDIEQGLLWLINMMIF